MRTLAIFFIISLFITSSYAQIGQQPMQPAFSTFTTVYNQGGVISAQNPGLELYYRHVNPIKVPNAKDIMNPKPQPMPYNPSRDQMVIMKK